MPTLARSSCSTLIRRRWPKRSCLGSGTSPDAEVTDEYGVFAPDFPCQRSEHHQHSVKRDGGQEAHHRRRPPSLRDCACLLQGAGLRPRAAPGTERNSYSLPQPPYPEAAVMMTFVNMDSEGLVDSADTPRRVRAGRTSPFGACRRKRSLISTSKSL